MYPDDHDMNEIRLQLGLLKKDNEMVVNITNKLSESIDKIQEMNSNLLRMIALHDQKHDSHNKTENELKEDIKEIHSRITTTTRELHDKIDEVERHIATKLDLLRVELKQHEEADKATPITPQDNKVSVVMAEIDKYKFAIMAIAASLGWILGNINLEALSKLFK